MNVSHLGISLCSLNYSQSQRHLGLTCPHADRPSGEAAHLITRASQFVFLLELLAFVPTRVQNEDTSLSLLVKE